MSAGSDDNYKKFTAENTEVLGMSANAIFSQKAFVDFAKIKHPLLSDRDEKG
jgi:peroxiredoxin